MRFRLVLLIGIGFALETSNLSALAVIWTESFDAGVGRLNQTRGGGENFYIWNPATQSIDGTFRRSPETISRYADLGETLDLQHPADFRLWPRLPAIPAVGMGSGVPPR